MIKLFKPETSALLLIDFQVGTSQLIKTQSQNLTLKNGVALAKMAKIFDMPIVMTSSVEAQQQGPTSPELHDVAPEAFDSRIKRQGIVNAWEDPNFKAAVEATGRRQLVMAGVTTDICIVYPAISAVQDGYEVQVVVERLPLRRVGGNGAPAHAERRRDPDGYQHADGRDRPGLEHAAFAGADAVPLRTPAKNPARQPEGGLAP